MSRLLYFQPTFQKATSWIQQSVGVVNSRVNYLSGILIAHKPYTSDSSDKSNDPPIDKSRSLRIQPNKELSSRTIKHELDTDYIKGLPNLGEVEPHVYIKHVGNALKNAPSVSIVLELVKLHHQTMVKEHITAALDIIHKIIRNKLPSERKAFILKLHEDPTFQLLTVLAAKMGPFLSADDILNTMSTLSYLYVESSHVVFQLFIALAQHSVNDLRLNQLVHLGFILNKLPGSKQIKILHKLAAKVVELNLFKEVHLLDIRQLSNLLWVFGPDLSMTNIEKVMEAILNQRESNKFTKPILLLNILRRNAIRDEIVTRICLKKIRFQLKKGYLSLDDVQLVLEACRDLNIYNYDTFNVIDQFLAHKETDLPKFILLLDILVQCKFAPIRSIEKYTDFLRDEGCFQELVEGHGLEKLRMVLSPLVMMKITDTDICSAVDLYCSKLPYQNFLEEPNKGLLMEVTLYLLMLGCKLPWMPSLLDQLETFVCQDLHVANIWEEDKMDIVHKSSILLYLMKHSKFSEDTSGDLTWLKRALDLYSRWDVLQKPLEVLFGGNHYVKNSVFHQTILLDHLLMFDEHLKPIHVEISKFNVNKQMTSKHALDSLDLSYMLSSDVKKVGVCVLDNRHFLVNTGQLLGTYAQLVDTLQMNGISSLMVNHQCWKQVPDKEKLEFLRYKVMMAAKEGQAVLFRR